MTEYKTQDFSKMIFEDIINNDEVHEYIVNEVLEKNPTLVGKKFEKAIKQKEIEFANSLNEKIIRLQEIITKEEQKIQIHLGWWRKFQHIAGIGNKIDQNMIYDIHEDNLQEAFRLINEIAALLRGEKDIELLVVAMSKDGEAEFFQISESEVATEAHHSSYISSKTNREHHINEMRYITEELMKQENKLGVSQKFVDHFNQYFETSSEMIEREKSFQKLNINKGHITEAFFNHILTTHAVSDFSSFDEDIADVQSTKENRIQIRKELRGAVSNWAGWWRAGDVANLQIKLINNTRLASISSIKIMANQLVYLFNQNTFNWDRFYKVFSEKAKKPIKKAAKNSIKEEIA